jgi:hypothetical protein
MADSESGATSVRRRMRAVTGSSAVQVRLPARWGAASMVCAALRVLIRSASAAASNCGSVPGSGAVAERRLLSRSRRVVNSDR